MAGSSSKGLQEIYDSGAKRFDELEQTQKESFAKAAETRVDYLGKNESKSMDKLNNALDKLEADVRQYLDKAMEGINTSIRTEVEESKLCIARVHENLKLSAKNLTETINQLRESIAENFGNLTEHQLSMQTREIQRLSAEVQADGVRSAGELKAEAQKYSKHFESMAASELLQLLGSQGKLAAESYDTFASQVNGVREEQEGLSEGLRESCLENREHLDQATRLAKDELSEFLAELVKGLDNGALAIEERLKIRFTKGLDASKEKQTQEASKAVADLEKLYSEHYAALLIQEEDLRKETGGLADRVRGSVTESGDSIKASLVSSMEALARELKSRITSAREREQALSEERARLMQTVRNDLRELETSFEKRLSELAQKCLSRLSSICVDGEMAIMKSHESCAEEFNKLAKSYQETMDEKCSQMLRRVEFKKEEAIARIKLAGNDEAEMPVEPVQSPSERPGSSELISGQEEDGTELGAKENSQKSDSADKKKEGGKKKGKRKNGDSDDSHTSAGVISSETSALEEDMMHGSLFDTGKEDENKK